MAPCISEVYDTHLLVKSRWIEYVPEVEPIRVYLQVNCDPSSKYQMIRNKNDPFSEMRFDSPIRGRLDLIFDTFVSTDDDRSGCEPSVSLFSHKKTCIPLSDCCNSDSKALLRIRDVSNIRRLQLEDLRVE